jgi:hypothetical protein
MFLSNSSSASPKPASCESAEPAGRNRSSAASSNGTGSFDNIQHGLSSFTINGIRPASTSLCAVISRCFYSESLHAQEQAAFASTFPEEYVLLALNDAIPS